MIEIHLTIPLKTLVSLRKYTIFGFPLVVAIVTKLEKILGITLLLSVDKLLNNTSINYTNFPNIVKTLTNLRKNGFVNRLTQIERRYADEPKIYRYKLQSNSLLLGQGSDFFSHEKAMWRAIGEGMERYLWKHYDFYSRRQIKSSVRKISKPALDIFTVEGFSNSQRKKYHELQFTDETPFMWIQIRSLTQSKSILYPTQLISNHYFKQHVSTPLKAELADEPMIRWPISTGLSTGKNITDAIYSGMLEIIERDAFMITYYNSISPSRTSLAQLAKIDTDFRNLEQTFTRYNLEVYIIKLITDFPVEVYASIIIDRSGVGPSFTIGASADLDIKQCIIDSISESFASRQYLREKSIANELPAKKNKLQRLQYWARPENLKKIQFLFSGPITEISLPDKSINKNCKTLTSLRYTKKQLDDLIAIFNEKSQEICYTEISSPITKQVGLRSVVVVAPQMQPLHLDETVPYTGGKRMQSVPASLGYTIPLKPNNEPHPFP